MAAHRGWPVPGSGAEQKTRTAARPAHEHGRRREASAVPITIAATGSVASPLSGASMAPRIAASAIDRTMADSIRGLAQRQDQDVAAR
jgi:hypothetical protein